MSTVNTQKNLDLSAIYQLKRAPMERADLPAPIVELANRFNGIRATGTVLAETQISDDRALAVVRKLTRMGILVPLAPKPPLTTKSPIGGSAEPAFTALESSFFDTPLPPLEEHDEYARSIGERMELSFAELFARLQGREVIP